MDEELSLPDHKNVSTLPEFLASADEAELQRQLAVARKSMSRFRNVLRELAKS